MRWIAAAVFLASGCVDSNPLPEPPPLVWTDRGYPVETREWCHETVRAALRSADRAALSEAVRAGHAITCDVGDGLTPLDGAVLADDPGLVGAILATGANPSERWGGRGDHFPLELAITRRFWPGQSLVHADALVQLLLDHGADPNARWCPFETRGADYPGSYPCKSPKGVTPLVMATMLDQPGDVYRLLDAGADTTLEDWYGRTALDYARSEIVIALLVSAMFSGEPSRDAAALAYLTRREYAHPSGGPWDQLPLTQAIFGAGSLAMSPPPPPPPGFTSPPRPSQRVARVRWLLRIGANPNQRLSWANVDWTPLAVAIQFSDLEVVRALLEAGADPNARWCTSLARDREATTWPRHEGCTLTEGMTPLAWANRAQRQDVDLALLEHGADPTARDVPLR